MLIGILIVLISVVANSIAIVVMIHRRKRIRKFQTFGRKLICLKSILIFFCRSTHVLLIALAVSDICFSVAIHPMLVVTSFGIDSENLFGVTGHLQFFQIN